MNPQMWPTCHSLGHFTAVIVSCYNIAGVYKMLPSYTSKNCTGIQYTFLKFTVHIHSWRPPGKDWGYFFQRDFTVFFSLIDVLKEIPLYFPQIRRQFLGYQLSLYLGSKIVFRAIVCTLCLPMCLSIYSLHFLCNNQTKKKCC